MNTLVSYWIILLIFNMIYWNNVEFNKFWITTIFNSESCSASFLNLQQTYFPTSIGIYLLLPCSFEELLPWDKLRFL